MNSSLPPRDNSVEDANSVHSGSSAEVDSAALKKSLFLVEVLKIPSAGVIFP